MVAVIVASATGDGDAAAMVEPRRGLPLSRRALSLPRQVGRISRSHALRSVSLSFSPVGLLSGDGPGWDQRGSQNLTEI